MKGLRVNVLAGDYPFDLAGRRFEHLLVLDFNYVLPNDDGVYWLCRCDCGKESFMELCLIRLMRSCGCILPETKYMFSVYYPHPDFMRLAAIFNGMKQRCYNENDNGFRWYGARGITICPEWLDDRDLFIAWALANGYAPHLTIDRRDNYSGYCPANCRWITLREQQLNKRVHQDAREAHSKSLGLLA